MYGTEPGTVSFANNCLLARRLVERGVRFVQLYHRGLGYARRVRRHRHRRPAAAAVPRDRSSDRRAADRPQAARPARYDARRLGRRVRTHADQRGAERLEAARPGSPSARVHDVDGRRRDQAGRDGRAQTDELGYNVVEDPVDVHDLHATMLHLMGFDHKKLTYKFQGRDFRLTDVPATSSRNCSPEAPNRASAGGIRVDGMVPGPIGTG